MAAQNNRKWNGKSYGGYFGNLSFAMLLRIGIWPAYFLLVFVAAFFAVFRRKAMRGGEQYLARILTSQKIDFFQRYKLAFSFGVSILDKVSFFANRGQIECDDQCIDSFENLLRQNKGLIVITSHIGGWQIAGSHLSKYGRKFSVLGLDAEDEKIAKILERERHIPKLEFLGSPDDALGILPAYESLKSGELVAMHGDRYVAGKGLEVDFLGAKVKIPEIAWALASKTGAPVVNVICVREKLFKYKMFCFAPVYLPNLRGQKLYQTSSASAQNYMDEIAATLKKYPYQWFNFYPFWGE